MSGSNRAKNARDRPGFLEVPAMGDTLLRWELADDLRANFVEKRRFRIQIFRPVGGLNLLYAQLMRNVGMPQIERLSTLSPRRAPQEMLLRRRSAEQKHASPP